MQRAGKRRSPGLPAACGWFDRHLISPADLQKHGFDVVVPVAAFAEHMQTEIDLGGSSFAKHHV